MCKTNKWKQNIGSIPKLIKNDISIHGKNIWNETLEESEKTSDMFQNPSKMTSKIMKNASKITPWSPFKMASKIMKNASKMTPGSPSQNKVIFCGHF